MHEMSVLNAAANANDPARIQHRTARKGRGKPGAVQDLQLRQSNFLSVQGRLALRPGDVTRRHASVPELVAAIDEYVAHHNTNPKPFIWTKSARDILQEVIRANARLSAKQNETLH